MKVEATVSPAVSLGEGVWMASVQPDSVRALAREPAPLGETSVILLPGSSLPATDAGQLVFETSGARVLTIGRSTRAVFIYDLPNPGIIDSNDNPNGAFGPRIFSDDDRLNAELESLPAELATGARELVNAVRSIHPGRFERTESGKYIYRPNFWTVRVQPRDRSLAITVYGRGESLGSPASLTILPDQNSYSRFKIASRAQLADALEVITRAAALKNV